MRITRRAFLAGLVATAACSSSSRPDAARPETSATTAAPVGPDPFTLGVASGDPDTTSVVLWTRLLPDGSPLDGDLPVTWELLAGDGDDVIASGETVAEARYGHSVHAIAGGLDPATSYRYRFTSPSGHRSPVGTTRTAPADEDAGAVALAVASCQRYDDGYWAAHRDIAAADVDLVVFLGDYVYESAQRSDPVRPIPARAGAVADLAGYRSRYEAARRDTDLAAAHAAHPWVVTWDDHEVLNDHAGGDGSIDPARLAAAYQAWWEHMPVRVVPPEGPALRVHRSQRWGSTLELLLLDTRQHRAEPPCGGGVVAVECADLADADRSVLGEEQEAWLLDRLAAPAVAWTSLAQSVLLAPLQVAGRLNGDAWDGYPPARDRVTAALTDLDAVVLTGDLHVQLVVDVAGPAGSVVATELVAPSISSRPNPDLAGVLDLLPTLAPQVVHGDSRARGWLRCDVEPDRWLATYREVVDAADPVSDVIDGARFEIRPGRPGAVEI